MYVIRYSGYVFLIIAILICNCAHKADQLYVPIIELNDKAKIIENNKIDVAWRDNVMLPYCVVSLMEKQSNIFSVRIEMGVGSLVDMNISLFDGDGKEFELISPFEESDKGVKVTTNVMPHDGVALFRATAMPPKMPLKVLVRTNVKQLDIREVLFEVKFSKPSVTVW